MQKRQPQVHRVKSWVHLFQAFVRGEKLHDLRVLDRDYQVGDILVLCEYDKQQEKYTGREAESQITYITSSQHVACAFSPFALKEKFAILSIKPTIQMSVVDDKYAVILDE
jgi:Domain of unknown function (DUF3850)